MKRFLKWSLGVGAVFVLGVGLVFIPSVQKQIILNVGKGRVESFNVANVDVSLSRLRLENVEIRDVGIEVNADWIELDMSLFDIIFGKPLVVEAYRMEGSALVEGQRIEYYIVNGNYSEGVVFVDQLLAEVLGGDVQGSGQLTLLNAEDGLYKLSGDVVLTDFPADVYDPGRGAPVSGLWSAVGDFSSKAESLELLGEALVLDLDLIGKDGSLQFTRLSEEAASMGDLVSSGLSLFGMFSKDPSYHATAALVGSLKRIEFGELKLNLNRFSDGRLEIEELHISGRDLMIKGSGIIDSQNWATLVSSPLSLNLVFGTRGKLDESARVLSLVGTQQLDYYSLWKNPIPITGTLSKVELDALTDLVGGGLGW